MKLDIIKNGRIFNKNIQENDLLYIEFSNGTKGNFHVKMKKHVVPGEDLDPWHPGDDYIYYTPCVIINNISVEINSNDSGYNFACFVERHK